jgi:hypothetical protein
MEVEQGLDVSVDERNGPPDSEDLLTVDPQFDLVPNLFYVGPGGE